MEGPFFFGAAQHLESALESAHKHADVLILRLSKVPFIDATGMQSLWDLLDACKRHHTRLVLSEARPNVLEKLKTAGLVGQLGKENVLSTIHQLM
jgi:SulP family sulfate permease